jgi:hypothetical protein
VVPLGRKCNKNQYEAAKNLKKVNFRGCTHSADDCMDVTNYDFSLELLNNKVFNNLALMR